MGYYPPFVPDSYLLNMRKYSVQSYGVKKVERIEKVHIEQQRIEQRNQWRQTGSKEDGKGFYLDLYV